MRPGKLPGRFERFMSIRYLIGMGSSSRSHRFLRFITMVGVGGVAVGVCALILALSITRGFSRTIQEKIVDFGGHVQVENMQDAPLGGIDSLVTRLRAYPEIKAVVPVVQELTLLRSSENIDGIGLWGTPDSNALLVDNIIEGSPYLSPVDGRPVVVVSQMIARTLGIETGDLVTTFSLGGSDDFAAGGIGRLFARPKVKQFKVAGIYDTGFAEFDQIYAFTDLRSARGLFGYTETEASRLDVYAESVAGADDLAFDIELDLGFPVLARSVEQVNQNLFDWINLQESIIPLVIGIIIFVAALSIIGILLMMVLEKTKDVGILISMGASAGTIRRLFQRLGFLIGLAGLIIGELFALILAMLQIRCQIIPLPEETYYMDVAPIALNVFDFLIVAAIALPLCTLAAYVPARVASRTDPVRTIRFAN